MARMQRNGSPASASIVLTVDLEVEPIHGFVDDGSAASIEFTGWLELMPVVEKLRVRALIIGSKQASNGRIGS
jgi:hypothetical protein